MPKQLPPASNAWEAFSYVLADMLGFGPSCIARAKIDHETAA